MIRGKMPGSEKRLNAAIAAIQTPPRADVGHEAYEAERARVAALPYMNAYMVGAHLERVFPRVAPALYSWGTRDVLVTPLALVDAQCTLAPVVSTELAPTGAYDDEAGFLDYVAGRGWSTLADAAEELIGNECRLGYAQFGDVIFRPNAGVGSLLVSLGTAAVTPNRTVGRGLERVPFHTLQGIAGVRAFHLETAALTRDEARALCAGGIWSCDRCTQAGLPCEA